MQPALWALSKKTAKVSSIASATFHRNAIFSYWWQDKPNFGDLITPALLKRYGLTAVHTAPKSCQLISTGSVLHRVPPTFSGIVIGSGLIKDMNHPLPNAKILAVRGELTRRRIRAHRSTTLGDPGLLAEDLLLSRSEKKFVLGFVPHYVDADDPRLRRLADRYPKHVRIINVMRSPQKVLAEIDRCEHIISSSLHGVIAADALGIRRAWACLSDRVAGDGFKFHDYSSGISSKIEPVKLHGTESLTELLKLTSSPSCNLAFTKNNLRSAFSSIRSLM